MRLMAFSAGRCTGPQRRLKRANRTRYVSVYSSICLSACLMSLFVEMPIY